MIKKVNTFFIFLLIFSIGIFFASNVFAEEKSSDVDLQIIIKTLQEQIKNLQTQITGLQSQLETVNVKIEALTFTKTLSRGVRGDDVKQVQEFLKNVYPEAKVTGYFGLLTENLVKRFQEEHNIESVGFVGPKTIAKLNEVLGVLPATPATPAVATDQKTIPAVPATPALLAKTPSLLQPVVPIVSITELPPLTFAATSSSNSAVTAATNSVSPASTPAPASTPVPTSAPAAPASTPVTPTSTPAVVSTPPSSPAPATANTTPSSTSSDTTPPSMPTNLTATAVSTSQIVISWTASTDNVAVTGYKIFRDGMQVITSSTNGYGDTGVGIDGLKPSTTYIYTVSAYDAAGNDSAQSVSVSGTTRDLPPPPPAAPTNLTATVSPGTSSGVNINLNWTDNANNEDGFYFEILIPSRTWERYDLPAANTQSYIYKNVLPGNYLFQLRSYTIISNISSVNWIDNKNRSTPASTSIDAQLPACTNLSISLDKTIYSSSDYVRLSYVCSPPGSYAPAVTTQLIKPDGTTEIMLVNYNVYSSGSSNFPTSVFPPGAYALSVCFGNHTNCQQASPVATATFSIGGNTTNISAPSFAQRTSNLSAVSYTLDSLKAMLGKLSKLLQ